MGKSRRIAGINTAKRKIQIRNYIQQRIRSSCDSNPFLDGDEFDPVIQISADCSFDFASSLISEDSSPSMDTDDILNPCVNLDEADKYISSLKLPRKRLVEEPQNSTAYSSNTKISKLRSEISKLYDVQDRVSDAEDSSESPLI